MTSMRQQSGWEMRRCGLRALGWLQSSAESWSLDKVSPSALLGGTGGAGTLMLQPPCDRTRLVGALRGVREP